MNIGQEFNMNQKTTCNNFQYHHLNDYNLNEIEYTLTKCNITAPYHNSIGKTFADVMLDNSLSDSDLLWLHN